MSEPKIKRNKQEETLEEDDFRDDLVKLTSDDNTEERLREGFSLLEADED